LQYNLVNQSWSTQNEDTQNRRLCVQTWRSMSRTSTDPSCSKKEMGFAGWIVSDWGAQHSGVASVLAGLDQTMPGQLQCCSKEFTGSFWGANLTMAVNNGSVPAERVQDAATRILAGWYLLGQDKDYPRPNFDAFDPFYGAHLNAINDARTAVSREVATAGQVLLKNKNGALPFKKLRKLAIVGSDAAPARGGANGFSDRGGVDGVVGIGWGSGTADYASLISPYEALQRRARKEGTGFAWSFLDFDTQRAAKISDERLGVDAAVVFVHSDSGEGYITVDGNAGDRNNLTLWANGDELIQAVAAVNSNTIVVMHSPGQVDMERFADHPNVTAIIQAHMPGSEAGHAIADVLYGDANPSGRLPYTIAKKRSDYSADVICAWVSGTAGWLG
jgi:beta-glucosidase